MLVGAQEASSPRGGETPSVPTWQRSWWSRGKWSTWEVPGTTIPSCGQLMGASRTPHGVSSSKTEKNLGQPSALRCSAFGRLSFHRQGEWTRQNLGEGKCNAQATQMKTCVVIFPSPGVNGPLIPRPLHDPEKFYDSETSRPPLSSGHLSL